MKLIVSTHYKRPDCTRSLLNALRLCEGIGEYTLLFHVEPGNDEVRSILEGVDFAETILVFNKERLGCNRNTDACLSHAFSLTDYAIYFDDDLVPAPDTLEYFEWAEQFKDDPKMFSISGYHWWNVLADEALWHIAQHRLAFTPWGRATWKDRWVKVEGRLDSVPNWCASTVITRKFVLPNRWVELYPAFGRVQNIGWQSSLHEGVPETYFKEVHTCPYWAGDYAVPAGSWFRA